VDILGVSIRKVKSTYTVRPQSVVSGIPEGSVFVLNMANVG
jgi:hypothetical protein